MRLTLWSWSSPKTIEHQVCFKSLDCRMKNHLEFLKGTFLDGIHKPYLVYLFSCSRNSNCHWLSISRRPGSRNVLLDAVNVMKSTIFIANECVAQPLFFFGHSRAYSVGGEIKSATFQDSFALMILPLLTVSGSPWKFYQSNIRWNLGRKLVSLCSNNSVNSVIEIKSLRLISTDGFLATHDNARKF